MEDFVHISLAVCHRALDVTMYLEPAYLLCMQPTDIASVFDYNVTVVCVLAVAVAGAVVLALTSADLLHTEAVSHTEWKAAAVVVVLILLAPVL